VIGEEKGLAQQGLAVTPGEGRMEIGLGIGDQRLHRLQITLKCKDALGPCSVAGRRSFRPVLRGPVGGLVLGIAAELKDVPLRDAQVFEQHPGGVGKVRDFFTAEFHGKVLDHIFELRMSAFAFEQVDQMIAECFVRIRLRFRLHRP